MAYLSKPSAMKSPTRSLLLHPVFLINLIVLIINDNWLKYAWPGFITGKLSDVTGIFVFIVFLNAMHPNKKWFTAVFTVLFFTWWKSPLSGAAIAWINETMQLPVQRVVDYTDLFALLVIPVAWRLQPFEYKTIAATRFVKPVAFLFTLHAICATSMYRPGYITPANQVWLDKTYKTKLTEEQVLGKLDSLHIAYQLDSVEMYPAITTNLYLKVEHGKDSTEWVSAAEMENPRLYYQYKDEPYYKIPRLELEQDTLKNIKFRVQDLGRKRSIEVISVEVPGQMNLGYYMQPRLYKKYRKMIKAVLVE